MESQCADAGFELEELELLEVDELLDDDGLVLEEELLIELEDEVGDEELEPPAPVIANAQT